MIDIMLNTIICHLSHWLNIKMDLLPQWDEALCMHYLYFIPLCQNDTNNLTTCALGVSAVQT